MPKLKLAALKAQIENAKAQAQNDSLVVPAALSSRVSEEEKARFRTLFAFYDADSSGAISVDELAAVLERLGLQPSKSNLNEMLRAGESHPMISLSFLC